MRLALATVVVGLLALVVFTGWALESSGVVVVETRKPDGSTRSTSVWFLDRDGVRWLEAGTPENGWYQDIERDPRLVLREEGRAADYRAEPVLEPGARDALRTGLREKYGVRDWWIGVLFDTSHSIPVRLNPPTAEPQPPAPPRP